MYEILCSNLTLDNIEKISNIIIALLTLIMGFYIFIYQRNKDKKDRKSQWVKDLIIQPKFGTIDIFFYNIENLKSKIESNELDELEKIEIIKDLKVHASNFRKNFITYFLHLAPKLHDSLQNNIDNLIDELTIVISNDEFKLCNEITYNREIVKRITDSQSYVLQILFEYDS